MTASVIFQPTFAVMTAISTLRYTMEAELRQQLEEIKQLTLLGAKNVLSVNDVAFLLGKSPKTVRNMVDEIPHYRNGHGIWFKRSEVEAWQCQVKHNVIAIK